MELRFGFVSVLLLCLGLCSSCEDERFDTGSTMPDGQFIVDYTAEAGKATRALHENVLAGERINSLTYLLYSEDGTLLKRREVPELDGDEDTWPLRRETMTWKQREALKDTLQTNTTYHAVFIANIDSAKLWDNVAPLKSAGDYNDAYIELPAQPFEDGNMFYYFAQDINSADKSADRDTPYNCSVQLHRIVTRTDFFFEQLPAWDGLLAEENIPSTTSLRVDATDEEGEQPIEEEITPPTEEGGTAEEPTDEGDEPSDEDDATTEEGEGDEQPVEDEEPEEPVIEEPSVSPVNPATIEYPVECVVPDTIQTYFSMNLQSVMSTNYMSLLIDPITESTGKFLTALSAYFTEKAGEAGDENPNYDTYMGYVAQIASLQEEIKSGSFVQTILEEADAEGQSKLMTHLQNWMLNGLAKNDSIKSLWKQSEAREKAYADIVYDDGGGLNQFFFNKDVTHTPTDIANTPRTYADADTTVIYKYKGFNVVGFANPTGNKMTIVRWYETPEAANASYVLNMSQDDNQFIQTEQDINEKVVVFYRPIASLSLNSWDNNKKSTQVVCDLEDVLLGDKTEYDALKEAIQTAFKEEQTVADYGTFDQVILELEWPDLSKPEVLKITPDWKIDKGN